jgi:hypothetical protein
MAKATVMFKTPDALDQIGDNDELKEFIERFVQWGEYIKIEFDDVANTAVVLEVE